MVSTPGFLVSICSGAQEAGSAAADPDDADDEPDAADEADDPLAPDDAADDEPAEAAAEPDGADDPEEPEAAERAEDAEPEAAEPEAAEPEAAEPVEDPADPADAEALDAAEPDPPAPAEPADPQAASVRVAATDAAMINCRVRRVAMEGLLWARRPRSGRRGRLGEGRRSSGCVTIIMTVMPVAAVHLHTAGVSAVVAVDDGPGRLPWIAHWGPDLGEPTDADLAQLVATSSPPVVSGGPDGPVPVSLLPSEAEAWMGRPGLAGSRRGRDFSPEFSVTAVTRLDPGAEPDDQRDGTIADGLRVDLADATARLEIALTVQLTASGLLRVRAELTNTDPESDYRLDALVPALPVPADASELLDLAGHHARERVPQRRPFIVGVHARESRQGRPGLDGPLVLAAGTPGFGFQRGPVWGIHLGWSGNQALTAEWTSSGERVLAGGELLLPGELILPPGGRYTSPWLYGSYGDGLTEFARRFHGYLRSRPRHPSSPRPVTLNTWEAVYFDHRLDRLTALAEAAARVGVERFVLDDGWFRGRRHDRAGLGDWQVDRGVWPDGLHPLVDVVQKLGMQFGLWVEPEMVNLDSDLARAHPDWLLRAGSRAGREYRHQHVLDLANDGAYDYLAGRLHALLDEYPIGYLKWDHNRPVTEAGHQPGGEPGVHHQTLAVYRLMDELRAAHPGLEIESCASGGGRIDLGILARTDRVWTSDCIDALDRQQIQRYTQLVLPPELMGAHIGGPVSHTTGRVHRLDLRAGTALWGHLGIEWDLTAASEEDLEAVTRWVRLHQELRGLLHTGTVVVGDHPDPAIWVSGVVAGDRSEAVYQVVAVDRSLTWPPGRARLPGLDPDRRYRVAPLEPAAHPGDPAGEPDWWAGGTRLPGRMLGEVGVQVPALPPERLALLRCRAV